MEYVVDQDEVSVKPATLERKNIQSTKPVLVRQISHAFDHTSGLALYVLHLQRHDLILVSFDG